jgi:uncharacterized protein (TIGR03086 family)
VYPDLRPAAVRMADLVCAVPDSRLDAPTPCSEYSLGDLLDHVGGFALAFTAAAEKDGEAAGAQGPSGDAARLEEGWRDRIAGDVIALGEAWRDPAAWSGMTAIGVELPGDVAGLFALDELVIHGWDVARASRQPFHCDAAALEALHALVLQLSDPQVAPQRDSLFGPVMKVAPDQPLLDRVVGLTGRDPAW